MASEAAQRRLAALRARGLTETVTYRPYAGTARSIEAVVDRQGPGGPGQATAPGLAVHVLNDAVLGVELTMLDGGRDRIGVAERVGGPPVDRHAAVVGQDADWLELSCR